MKQEIQVQNESNMDLFRVCIMLFVLGHHYLGYIPEEKIVGTFNFLPVFFLKHLFVIAVNCFILMSGYFLSKSTFKIVKAVHLLLKTSMYSVILFTIFSILGYGDHFSISMLVKSFLPLRGWWFMFPYFIMFLFSPFINIFIAQLNQRKFVILLILLFIVEVIWPSLVPGSAIDVQQGYCLYNFIYLYFIGAYFRNYKISISATKIMFACLSIVALSTAIHYLLRFNLAKYDFFKVADRFYNYNFLFVSIAATLFFLFFKQLKINFTQVSVFRPYILAVYLIHKQVNFEPFLFNHLFNVGKYNTGPFLLLHLLFFIFSTFLLCIAIDFILTALFDKFLIFLSKKAESLIKGWLNNITVSTT